MKVIFGKKDPFPNFKYYPAASIATHNNDVFAETEERCPVCRKKRGWAYVGPLYGVWEDYTDEDLEDAICPWCIASGDAFRKFKTSFNGVGELEIDSPSNTVDMSHNHIGIDSGVPKTVFAEINYRTPGIKSWQEANWFFHCADAATFLGAVGTVELTQYGADAIEAIRENAGKLLSLQELDRWMSGLSRKGSPTAYLFQCQKCKKYGGFSDCD